MCFESIFFSYFRYCDGELLSLCNWLRHSLLSLLLLRLGICFHTGRGWKMYFSVTRARVRERWIDGMSNRVSCRRETARPPPLPLPTENACNFRPMGGIYITRARKTAIRPTELRLYRGRVCACLSLSLSLSTSASKYPLGPTRPTCALELLKFGRTLEKIRKKGGGRKTQFEIE